MLSCDVESGRMSWPEMGTEFADRPYLYRVQGAVANGDQVDAGLTGRSVHRDGDIIIVSGLFEPLGIALEQRLRLAGSSIQETITFRNTGPETVSLTDIGLGFAADLARRPEWRLCAVPFRIQLDGSRHDYAATDLMAGNFHNAVYQDPSRPDLPLTEDGRLRSEAWAWWRGVHGLVVIKYNNIDIELSVAAPVLVGKEQHLRFGGCGSSLYGEPSRGHQLPGHGEFTFGTTYYYAVDGPIEEAFTRYRQFLDAQGHGFPPDYDPPVNWNELYDVGWYHSNREELKAHYTRERLLREAEKAKACRCELLYLDPGWEVTEGTTLWDEERLGSIPDLIAVLRDQYGLDLGFRTILRCYSDHWPQNMLILHDDQPRGPVNLQGAQFWEPCLCAPAFWRAKVERIADIVKHGVRFLMVDEMDWRGPCSDPRHGHAVPTAPGDHVKAVYGLCRELRRRFPSLTIECHDPVWPWSTALYTPTYFRQGFGEKGDYDENWGFEYMWDCINDLKTGKALSLYYYNLACNIPIYLHITMAADNDNCLFFWWAASTVRHLGIGGKLGDPSVTPQTLAPFDHEARFEAYQKQMTLYQKLKPFFVRGAFHGIKENLHLHTLPGQTGGVAVLFNLTDQAAVRTAALPLEELGWLPDVAVEGADASVENGTLRITAELPPMAPAVVCIGDAVEWLRKTSENESRRNTGM